MSTPAQDELRLLADHIRDMYGTGARAVSELIAALVAPAHDELRADLWVEMVREAIRTSGVNFVPETDSDMEYELPVMLYWNLSEGYIGDPHTPDDPPHLEDVRVMLGEHDITDLLPADMLADVREAMLRDMEAGQ